MNCVLFIYHCILYCRVLHCRNAPSPAATSSLAIAKLVVDRMEQEFSLSLDQMYTQYSRRCTLSKISTTVEVHSVLCILYCIYNVLCTLYSAQCTLWNTCPLSTVYSLKYMYSVHPVVYSLEYVYSVHPVVYSLEYMYSVHPVVYSLEYMYTVQSGVDVHTEQCTAWRRMYTV